LKQVDGFGNRNLILFRVRSHNENLQLHRVRNKGDVARRIDGNKVWICDKERTVCRLPETASSTLAGLAGKTRP
jgi:hypothetical protein